MNEAHVLHLVARLAGFVAILQTAESLKLLPWFKAGGVWSWKTLENDFASSPAWIRTLLTRYLDDFAFEWLLWIRLVAALIVMFRPEFFGLIFLLISGILISIRFRGAFNGASDSMTLMTLTALSIGSLLPDSARLVQFALVLISAQVVISYFAAGIRKLKEPSWRDGTALAAILAQPPVLENHGVASATAPTAFYRLASVVTLLFECLFPLSLSGPAVCLGFLAAGVVFHWLNHRLFGLNRFFWAWVITYPAVYACVLRLHHG